ncbi:MAG: hypothetical protein HYV26_02700 [Candidatus Hydrogenedentes bacterium]|nr:hypothetical protein [Candidatus Hydrogenedentota bacterium]
MNYSWGSAAPDKNPLCAETYPHICYIGAVLGGAVNGATSLNFWRYNHAVNLDPIQRRREGVKLAFSMLDTLAAWGGRTARIPQDIAILRSRASEDWFQLKVLYGDYPGDRIDNTRGFDHFHWLALQLLQNGYLFETYFQDHAEAWEHAESFKVIILPFPYSMSMTAFGTLAAAVAKGVRVIAIGARGETDELGNPYPQPLLKGLNDDGKVGYFDPDLQEKGSYPETVKTFFKPTS